MKHALSVLSSKRRKQILRSLGPVTINRPHFFNLDRAFVCSECFAVSEAGARCPRCESTALVGLWRFTTTETSSARVKVSLRASQARREPSFYRPVSIAS